MRLWLPTAMTLSTLPLLMAGYIRAPRYPAGYLSEPASTPEHPAGYLPEPTSTPAYPAGYLPKPTSRRPNKSTTPRLTYNRIYSGAAREPHSSKVDRSGRGRPYRFPSSATKSDRVGLVESLDRSDTYHTGSGDVCGDFQTIGLGAGAASLLAFLVYILLTNSLTSTVASTTTTRQAAGADPWLARTTVTATCAAADLLEGHRSRERPWARKPAARPNGQPERHSEGTPDEMSTRFPANAGNSSQYKEDSAEKSSEEEVMFGEESSLRLATSNDIATNHLSSAPLQPRHNLASSSTLRQFPDSPAHESRVSPRQFGDDCFSEMIGALAGLAGLGALSGFSLSQSAQALLTSMMTISALTSTTTTTTTTTTGTARLMGEAADQVTGLDLVSRMAALAVTRGDLTCVRRDLCRLVRGGRRAGRPYDTALPLASLPFTWLLSKRTGHRFSDLCWVIPEAMEAKDCDDLYLDCVDQEHD